jgi:uncharacterized protein YfaS (alpha-2-macroglobulin family)
MRFVFGCFAACLGVQGMAQSTEPSESTPSIESFVPQGTAKNVRQVQVRFATPMVAFGDPRAVAPFDVACVKPGSGRWLDDRNWSYDFERDLPAGVRCRFTLRKDLRDIAGNALRERQPYTFSTGGPMILYSEPFAGNERIDENQIFMLGLDAPVSEKSLLKNAWCQAEGVNEKIGVRIVGGQPRRELLAQRATFIRNFARVYFRQGSDARSIDAELENIGADDPRLAQLPIVLLQCSRSLFPGTRVDLVWGAGIDSTDGIASDVEQSLSFRTRPEFNARFACERVSLKAQCIPFLPMSLRFSAPVKVADAQRAVLRAADGQRYTPEPAAAGATFVDSVTFKGPFPEQTRFALELPAGLRDDAQRKLANAASFPLAVATDEMPPLAKFAAPFGIVEAGAAAALPVTLRNVEAQVDTRLAALPGRSLRLGAARDQQIMDWYYRLQRAGQIQWGEGGEETNIYPGEQSLFKPAELEDAGAVQRFELPKPGGAAPFEVVGIPLPKPGFYVVELASPRLGAALNRKQTPMYVAAGALVTNLAVHFKRGTESSLVWVTALDSAQPVDAAEVVVRDCTGRALWQGRTAQNGVARIMQALPKQRCDERGDDYFISARHGDDMAFALSSWSGGIQPWRFNLPTGGYDGGNRLVHTVFDRTLLMANDTLHMKHFRRLHTQAGLVLPGKDDAGPDKLSIRHVGSDQTYELPLAWNKNGSAESSWQVPADAKQGTYNIEIDGRAAGTFRVEAFRVPTMRALLQGPNTAAVQPRRVELDVQLNYLAGGAAAHAPVKLRSALEERALAFPAYEDYVFANGPFPEKNNSDAADDEAAGSGQTVARTRNLELDANGAARVAIDELPRLTTPSTLRAELEYRDANGAMASAATRIPLWPARYLVGLRSAAEDRGDGQLQIVAQVVDPAGQPVPQAQVSVELFQRSYLSHRRRLLGGFYAYEHTQKIEPLGSACSGVTDRAGELTCTVAAKASGNLIVQATTTDPQGNTSSVHQDRWVAGADDQWFAASDNDRIDIVPERKRYEPGETARLQVRMPFREATALITVEREGVLDTYVQPLTGKDPVVRVPIKQNYAPNLYVSVFVVRGRVGAAAPTALVDLGKPAYRMGIAELQVGWRAHELDVAVATDKPVYKVRDRARVQVQVRRADGSAPPAGSEIALAAVDEGLLELQPNDSWKLLEAMLQRRPLEVETATAQLQVIGKRHFGRKAVPHGGGGGRSSTRELLDAMLFWRGRVALDANGAASIELPLNDALTSFRIVAVASGGAGLFGTGATTIRSTQDLILIGGLPPLVREGDRQRAGFTVRNTSAQPLRVVVAATAKPLPDGAAKELQLAPQTIEVGPGAAQEIGWPLDVPEGIAALQWEVSARAENSHAGNKRTDDKNQTEKARATDRLRIEQKVTAAYPLRTLQATLAQLDQPLDVPVQMPARALPGRGGIETVLLDRLGDALPGVREYMAAYPYNCFEQRASQAVALRSPEAWDALMATLPTYLDRDGLVKYFPLLNEGSEVLTAYVLSVADAAGYAIPKPAQQRMRDGLHNFVQGRVVRKGELPAADLSIRKLAALAALARSEPVRPQLLESMRIEPRLWPTSALLDWHDILRRSPELPQRDQALREVQQLLRGRLALQGSTAAFSTERSDALWWLMVSGDTNVNRLILGVLDEPEWRGDMARLVRGALGRQRGGHWDTTVANAWGVLALAKFSEKYESATVAGATTVQLSGAATAAPFDWSKNPHGGSVLVQWPEQPARLTVEHRGSGAPWALLRSRAAVPLEQPLASGYRIEKTVTAIEHKNAQTWSVGDIYRVRLTVDAQSDMTWVAIDDPVPAGATLLGSGLGTDSALLDAARPNAAGPRPVFEERGFAAFRAYYQYLPKGRAVLDYTVRIDNQGEFKLPATRVEAMYAPEVFGELPNPAWSVLP